MFCLSGLGRYLRGKPRLVQLFAYQSAPENLVVCVDSDWGGCLRTRRSTSGGVVKHGVNVIKSWSSTQATIAISSGEAENYAAVKGASVGLGIQSMMREVGVEVDLELQSDSAAALGIARRSGLGKMRHVDVSLLWLQQHVDAGKLRLRKIGGEANEADMLTKAVEVWRVESYVDRLGGRYFSGRSAIAPELAR